MTGRLDTTGRNVRRIADRIFPAMTAERLTPRAVIELFRDPLEVASALFASQLAEAADAAQAETTAPRASRLAPLEPLRDRGPRVRDRRDVVAAAPGHASEPARFSNPAARLHTSTLAQPVGAPPVSTRAGLSSQWLAATPAIHPTESGLGHRAPVEPTIDAKGPSPSGPVDRSAVEQVTTSFRPLSTRATRHKPSERSTPSATPGVPNDRVRGVVVAAAPRTPVQEVASGPPPSALTRERPPAEDDGVTRWVKGAAGLATLLAPPRPAAAAPEPPAWSLDVEPDKTATPSVVPSAPTASRTESASTDVELLIDELERRLELEYLRHYGTSGR